MSFIQLLKDLAGFVSYENDKMVDYLSDEGTEYKNVCVQSNITHDKYYQNLKKLWEKHINNFMQSNQTCSKISTGVNLAIGLATTRQLPTEDEIIDKIVDNFLNDEKSFQMSQQIDETLKNLIYVFIDKCSCDPTDILHLILAQYKKKYYKQLKTMDKKELKRIIMAHYEKFKSFVLSAKSINTIEFKNHILDDVSNKLTNLYGFSIGNELNTLIPSELGSLKVFFVKVISTYYEKLHPIIWAQIFKYIVEDLDGNLPLTQNELFQFISKHLLLNSGPCILKILQMIRPVISPETAIKYNINKLTYPVLSNEQVDMILSRITNPNMINVLLNRSASVGHVCIANVVNKPTDIFVIKIIKPLSIIQSCWEYKTLYDIFAPNTCEYDFITNMLKSNGREMNVNNEIENLIKGNKYYSCTYKDILSIDNGSKLSTVEYRSDVTKPSWYAFTMSLAPGMPLSDLIEENVISKDTKFRSRLHRCIDLLVFKFFYNLISNGFYHGDLHSGNIFFSYEKNQATLIDFGAVGQLNIFDGKKETLELLDIIIMAAFYNYDGILDKMTALLNQRCVEQQIKIGTPEYNEMKKKLIKMKLKNIINDETESKRTDEYGKFIFGSDRLAQEEDKNEYVNETTERKYRVDSIYTYLEHTKRKKELVIENKDVLNKPQNILEESPSVTFAQVLGEIIKFYAKSGINIAIKFSEFYELQKAYVLLLGVLDKIQYSSYRTSIMMGKAIKSLSHLTKLYHVKTVPYAIKSYVTEKKLFNEIKNNLANLENEPNIKK